MTQDASHAEPTHPTPADAHAHGHAPAPGPTFFSPEEEATFHAEDKAAGAHIVGLMLGIFALGLAGYVGIALWVAYGQVVITGG